MNDAVAASSADTQTPAPVSALEHALATGDQASYSAARQAERLGKPLEPIVPASAAGQPAEQAAETAASSEAASEPAVASGHKGNRDTRIQELLSERARERDRADKAERELAALRPSVETKPASHPAPTDGEPQLADFEADPATYPDPYAAYLRAVARFDAKHEAEATLSAAQEKAAAVTAQAELTKRADACQGRINAALAADPSLKDAIDFGQFDAVPSSLVKPGEVVTPQNDLAEAILEHDKPTDLMRYLSEQPTQLAALLASPNPRAFWRRLGQVEGRMAVPTKLAPKTITDAPTPPPTVGTRHESGTSLDVALKTGDQAAYNAERRRQRLAAMRQ